MARSPHRKDTSIVRRIALLLASASLFAGLTAGPVAAREPGPTIVDTAIAVNTSTGEFDHLIAAVVRAGLVDTLDGRRQFTVFAPTDAAFEDLFDALGVSGVDDIPVGTVRAVLLYHVAPGERFSADVLGSSRTRTLSKQFLDPSVRGGVAYIDDARIIAPDIDVSNGVIHVIDAVLLP
jgi:transforming growth factor-beta-induced protein